MGWVRMEKLKEEEVEAGRGEETSVRVTVLGGRF